MKAKAFWAMITTPFGWLGRMVSGASRNAISDGALTESPRRMMVREFFRRKLAVAALVTLVALFLFVFFGPLFVPLEINYTDPLQANVAPNASMLSVPRELKATVATMMTGVCQSMTFLIIKKRPPMMTAMEPISPSEPL